MLGISPGLMCIQISKCFQHDLLSSLLPIESSISWRKGRRVKCSKTNRRDAEKRRDRAEKTKGLFMPLQIHSVLRDRVAHSLEPGSPAERTALQDEFGDNMSN